MLTATLRALLNADGRHDLVYGCGPGSTTLTWFYSMGNGNWRTSATTRPAVALGTGRRLVGDFDGSGTADVVFRATGAATLPVLYGRNENGEHLQTITQGNGSVTQVEIASLVQAGNYTRGATVTAPAVVTTPAMRVVYRSLEDTGNGDKTVRYSYDSAVIELGTGRGFQGFASVTAQDDDVDTMTLMKYRYDWPYTGRLKARIVYQGMSNAGTPPAILSSMAAQFTCQNLATAPATAIPGGGAAAFAPGQLGNCGVPAPGARYQVWASRTFESHQDLNRTRLPGSQIDVSDMDKFGNPGRVRVDTLSPDGSASGNVKVTDTWYSNDEAAWLLGLPIRRTVTVTKP